MMYSHRVLSLWAEARVISFPSAVDFTLSLMENEIYEFSQKELALIVITVDEEEAE